MGKDRQLRQMKAKVKFSSLRIESALAWKAQASIRNPGKGFHKKPISLLGACLIQTLWEKSILPEKIYNYPR